MSEIQKLLQELRSMKSEDKAKWIANNRETWAKIGSSNWKDLGFENEEELKEWIVNNPYANVA